MNGLKERPQQAERVRLAVLVTDRWVAYYVRRYVFMFFPISQRRSLARSSVTRIARKSVRSFAFVCPTKRDASKVMFSGSLPRPT